MFSAGRGMSAGQGAMTVFSGWEGNRRTDQASQTRWYRQTIRAFKKGDKHSAYTRVRSKYGTVYLYRI